jgi:hypothetical protein
VYGSTKIIRSIRSFEILLKFLYFPNVSLNTFFGPILHKSESICQMCSKGSYVEKSVGIIIFPPFVKLRSA